MEDPQFDVTRKFVRVTGEREGGLIEFLRTISIKPLRQTFDHMARRIGPDKPATRYRRHDGCAADPQLPLPPHLGPGPRDLRPSRTPSP
jgi:hypothetical protein